MYASQSILSIFIYFITSIFFLIWKATQKSYKKVHMSNFSYFKKKIHLMVFIYNKTPSGGLQNDFTSCKIILQLFGIELAVFFINLNRQIF